MIRPSMRRHLGGLLAAGGALFALGLIVVGGIRERWAARDAFPTMDGRVALAGISEPISIFRDEHGIAHAEAKSRGDALRALGFVHAQDRLAQMTWLARLARGRTAEVIGPAGLPADRLARALNLSGAAETDLSRLSTGARAALEAYAEGVNAWIEQIRGGEVDPPIAMQRLGIPLEAWRPVDSLAVLKFYAWGLSSSIDASLVLWDLQERLGGIEARPFFPPEAPEDGVPGGEGRRLTAGLAGARSSLASGSLRARSAPVLPGAQASLAFGSLRARSAPVLPGAQASLASGSLRARSAPALPGAQASLAFGSLRARSARLLWRDPLRRAAGLEGRSVGSSAWVVGGAHTESGRPILVADSHLPPTAPALLHLAHVRGGDLDVAGAMVPGLPVVWTGHNPRVAWASTAARAAVIDLYEETLHPTQPGRYHDGREWRSLSERVESIGVRGADPEALVVRTTAHGPLVHEMLQGPRDPLALAWVGTRIREGNSFEAMFEVALARDAGELLQALSRLREPALAIVYADTEGAAGMQVAGWIPRREVESGFVPLPGRARWYDWPGAIPFDQLPAVRLAKGQGWAIAADNPLATIRGGEQAEWLWRTGVRARRLESRLRSALAAGPAELRRLASFETDVGEGRGTALVATGLRVAEEAGPLSREAREVADLLREWDGRSTPGSIGAAAFHVWLTALTEHLLAEPLGDELLRRYLALPQADPPEVVYAAVSDVADRDDLRAAEAERVREAVRRSLRESFFRLAYRLGPNRAKWRWGRLHSLEFKPFLPVQPGASPGQLGPYEVGGSGGTLNAAEYDPGAPYDVRIASIFRFAVDAGDLDEALFALAPGQSEHPRHRHYADGIQGWLEGRFRLLATSRVLVEQTSRSTLVLEPVRGEER
jgi:penicillin amidase